MIEREIAHCGHRFSFFSCRPQFHLNKTSPVAVERLRIYLPLSTCRLVTQELKLTNDGWLDNSFDLFFTRHSRMFSSQPSVG
jgi:hypothetical protein